MLSAATDLLRVAEHVGTQGVNVQVWVLIVFIIFGGSWMILQDRRERKEMAAKREAQTEQLIRVVEQNTSALNNNSEILASAERQLQLNTDYLRNK